MHYVNHKTGNCMVHVKHAKIDLLLWNNCVTMRQRNYKPRDEVY